LTIRTPSFIAAIASASIRPIVSGVFGTCRVTTSAGRAALELLGALHAELAKALRRDELVEGDDVHLEALRPLGDELAIRPKPITPSVLP
jgi:hypothetical protein